MTRPLSFALAFVAAFGLLACQKPADGGSGAATSAAASGGAELTTDDQKTVYALGLALARDFLFRQGGRELTLATRARAKATR